MTFALGKKDYVHDVRTLELAPFMEDVSYPKQFDFDHDRKPFPHNLWGNDQYGDCVKAGQANAVLRLERIEQRRTLKLSDQDVVNEYKKEIVREGGLPPQSPGDENDSGLVVLYNLRNWRNTGWTIGGNNYTIDAYGKLNEKNIEQIKRAIWLLHGSHIGILLPLTAQRQTDEGVWDDTGGTSAAAEPGSWGGHLVFCKRYSSQGIYAYTWGRDVLMTPAFIQRYVDEAWAVVDNIDQWRHTAALDVAAMEAKMRQIGISIRKQ